MYELYVFDMDDAYYRVIAGVVVQKAESEQDALDMAVKESQEKYGFEFDQETFSHRVHFHANTMAKPGVNFMFAHGY